MDCAKSLHMLSDLHDGSLDGELSSMVKTHLGTCPPCADIFADIGVIVAAARQLRAHKPECCPDENSFWTRLAIKPTIH